VVTFLDVRGFSSFAKIAESSDTAEFLKSIYNTMLDDYFSDADFFKPTGDGLLVLYRYDRGSLTQTVRSAVSRSVSLVEAFPSMCDEDPMVNFEVPTGLGVGLARGAATSLTSGEEVLDYSGRPLNLASRLMDLARPAGVVFDSSLGHDLLEEGTQRRFVKESAYVRGISEDEPIDVYCLKDLVQIPAHNKSPMNRFKRHTEATDTLTLRELSERGPYSHRLTSEPARKDDIEVHVAWPKVRKNGSKHPRLITTRSVRAAYKQRQNEHLATIDYRPIVKEIQELGVKATWSIRLTAEYSVRDDS